MPDRTFGLNVIRHRTLVKSFDNIIDGCVEFEGIRDPSRIFELLGVLGTEAQGMLGSDGEVGEIVEFMKTGHGAKLLEQQTTAAVLKLKMIAWGVVDSVARWVAEDQGLMSGVSGELPTTREALTEKFEQRMEEWLAEGRPEVVFAERAAMAMRRLDGVPLERLKTVDLWGALLVFLDVG